MSDSGAARKVDSYERISTCCFLPAITLIITGKQIRLPMPSESIPSCLTGAAVDRHPVSRGDLDTDLLPVYLLRFDRAQTRRAYENDLSQFFGSKFLTLRMARSISFVEVNAYLQALQQDGMKPATIRRKVSSIRGFFDWLIALGLIKANPADRQLVRRIDRHAKSQGVITVLTREQAQDLIEATQAHGEGAERDATLITVMIHCALRRSEAAAMDCEHIRPAGPYWVLDLKHTKGGSDEYVKVPAHVADMVQDHCRHYGIQSGALWRSLSRNRSRGNRLSPGAIYEIVRRAARNAGLDATVGAHTLRHTGCTLAIEAGASPQQVQTHARHKRLETTMGYIHQRDKLRDSAADFIKL